jgi:hypothetical protein
MKINLKNSVWLIAIGNFIFCNWYILYGYKRLFHSDSAFKVLYANEMFLNKEYFLLSGWTYVNGDLFTIFGHLFIIPILYVITPGFLSHSISGIASSLLIFFGIYLVLKLLSVKKYFILAVLASFAGGISVEFSENLFGQVSYGTVFYLILFNIFLTWKIIFKNKYIYLFLYLPLLVLLFIGQPQRAFIYYVLPMIISSILFYRPIKLDNIIFKNYKIYIIIFTSIIGYYSHNILLNNIDNISGASSFHLLPVNLDTLNNSLKIISELLDIYVNISDFNINLNYMYRVFKILSIIGILFLFIINSIHSFGDTPGFSKYFSVYTIVFSLVIFSLFFFTSLNSARYLVPALSLIFLCSIYREYKSKYLNIIRIFILIIFCITPINTFLMVYGPASQLERLGTFLQSKGLNYGYASYWNAGAVTVLTDGNVKIRQIQFVDGAPIPMHHLSAFSWYQDAIFTDNFRFLVVDDAELQYLNWPMMIEKGLSPINSYKLDTYNIYVFNKSFSDHLPKWPIDYSGEKFIPVTRLSNHQVGSIAKSLSGGLSLVSKIGEAGALHYGPYIDVPSGSYVSRFLLDYPENIDAPVKIDIVTNGGNKILASKVLRPSTSSAQLEFSISRSANLEFRVWVDGTNTVEFKGFTLVKLD